MTVAGKCTKYKKAGRSCVTSGWSKFVKDAKMMNGEVYALRINLNSAKLDQMFIEAIKV